ncbi:MAG: response regulator transcription factor [Lachnospiraceae bacterium]|nr:response regulator transcription factor [Lachnospiraceae bacterium]
MRLLYAEDEEDLNKVVTKKLTEEGFSVDSCFDGREAIDNVQFTEYDAAILDIMMPHADGFAVLKELRKLKKNTPVLFLTARDSIEDRVTGLDSGANDYLVKPFSFEELLARIRVLTREKHNLTENILSVCDLELNLSSHIVTRGGTEINLTSKEYQLLEYLLYNKEKVLSREKIENHIWNYDYEGGTNVIDVYIRYLRKKIDDGFPTKLIHTVRGAGYVIREENN